MRQSASVLPRRRLMRSRSASSATLSQIVLRYLKHSTTVRSGDVRRTRTPSIVCSFTPDVSMQIARPDETERDGGIDRRPGLRADQHPDFVRRLSAEIVESQCAQETDDALGNDAGGHGNGVTGGGRRPRQTIVAAGRILQRLLLDQTTQRGDGDARRSTCLSPLAVACGEPFPRPPGKPHLHKGASHLIVHESGGLPISQGGASLLSPAPEYDLRTEL
jgi:hypothetical protein